MYVLCIVVLVLALLPLAISLLGDRKVFADDWSRACILIPILMAIGAGAAVLGLLSDGEIGSTELWKGSIPGNHEIESLSDVPSYTLKADLEKSDRPVYLKVDSWGTNYINVQLELFDPGGKLMKYLPPETRIPCRRRVSCTPLIYKLQIVESGTYTIKIKSLSSWANDITVSFFQSDWVFGY